MTPVTVTSVKARGRHYVSINIAGVDRTILLTLRETNALIKRLSNVTEEMIEKV